MTELNLQTEIQHILQDKIFPNISIFEPGEMRIFLQDIPLTTDFEDDNDEKYFPCCIVKLKNGEIKTANDPQITTVEIIVCIKDMSKDMTGYQSLMIILQRIRNHFTSEVGIYGKHRMTYPISWSISEDFTSPYFVGNIVTKWVTDISPYKDPNDFL